MAAGGPGLPPGNPHRGRAGRHLPPPRRLDQGPGLDQRLPLGRYWSRGPQTSLYVPAPVLRPGANDVTVLELHAAATRHVHLRDTPAPGATEE
ncbi:hypothetical protein ACWFR1_21255 [Streptomyces sp. NPDC055103]